MEEKKLYEKYAYFFSEIKKLSEIRYETDPDLGSIGISKTAIQMAYRDINTMKFKGGIIDYLCYISTEMFLKNWLSDCENKSLIKINEKTEGISIKPSTHLNHNLHRSDESRNVLRLFFKNPKYFFESDYFKKISLLDGVEKYFIETAHAVVMRHHYWQYIEENK